MNLTDAEKFACIKLSDMVIKINQDSVQQAQQQIKQSNEAIERLQRMRNECAFELMLSMSHRQYMRLMNEDTGGFDVL